MTHSHFKALSAPLKAFSFDFEPGLLEPLQVAYQDQLAAYLNHPDQQHLFEGVYYHSEILPTEAFYLLSYDTYPLLWLSNHTLRSFQLFADFFQGLDLESALAGYLSFQKRLQIYSGFFVLGNRASEMSWHYDYRPGAPGYTLITPLFDWQPAHGNLCYRDLAGARQVYAYQKNQAIIFGEGFEHSTEPYPLSDSLRVLVSLTFGPDDFQSWDLLQQNIAEQSYYYHLPCGHVVDSCRCWPRWQRRQRLRQTVKKMSAWRPKLN